MTAHRRHCVRTPVQAEAARGGGVRPHYARGAEGSSALARADSRQLEKPFCEHERMRGKVRICVERWDLRMFKNLKTSKHCI